jgi:hypothetical protein
MRSQQNPAALRAIFAGVLIVSALSIAASKQIKYKTVSDNYSKNPPAGFEEHMKKEYG